MLLHDPSIHLHRRNRLSFPASQGSFCFALWGNHRSRREGEETTVDEAPGTASVGGLKRGTALNAIASPAPHLTFVLRQTSESPLPTSSIVVASAHSGRGLQSCSPFNSLGCFACDLRTGPVGRRGHRAVADHLRSANCRSLADPDTAPPTTAAAQLMSLYFIRQNRGR